MEQNGRSPRAIPESVAAEKPRDACAGGWKHEFFNRGEERDMLAGGECFEPS